jgi:SnoaL-like domain
MESDAIARAFVEAMNAFDLTAVRGMVTQDFTFTIGTHTADRDDFLASLATGPETDPEFRFEIDRIEGADVHGRQEYYWRETGERATSAARVLRLELAGGLVRRAAVEDAP